MNVTSS